MAENIIDIDLASFSYHDESQLKNINLQIEKGEFVILTGLSGCGKTTLLRLINGLIPDFYGGTVQGRVSVLGREVADYQKGELAKHMGNVFQNPKDQFFSTIAEDEVALVGENLGMDREILKAKVKSVMKNMAIDHLKEKSVFEMSGGERQKVAIATSLIYDTEIFLFDEPSASLDYQSTLDLKEALRHLKQLGKTIIVAEHRLFYLSDLCDRLLIMADGQIIDSYQQDNLSNAIRDGHDIRCLREESLLTERPPLAKSSPLITCQNITVQIKNKTLAENVNFDLQAGECMGIIGRNGVGKSTLAKELCGLLKLPKGHTSHGQTRRQRLRESYYVLQDADSQLFSHRVENELIPKNKLNDKAFLAKVKAYLQRYDLWDKRTEHPQEMSTGEKQRLAMLTAFVENRQLIILDEPTSGLDFRRMCQVAELINDMSQEIPIILITHDTELLFKACNSVLLMGTQEGKIAAQGNEEKIISFLKDTARLTPQYNP